MQFVTGMYQYASESQTTENGRPSVAKSDVDSLVSSFFKLSRGLSREALQGHLRDILKQADQEQNNERVVDAFVLWASTRDVRGGKGERDLANWWFVELARTFPHTCEALVREGKLSEYGSWRDLNVLLEDKGLMPNVRVALLQTYASQLKTDLEGGKLPSLAAKWAPREKSAHSDIAKEIARELFPDSKKAQPEYRKALSHLNKTLGTAEVLMCAQRWSEIKPSGVPSQCLLKKRKAFMNVKVKGTGARCDTADRVACAASFIKHALECKSDPKKSKMHGRVLHPHEMCRHYMHVRGRDAAEEDPIIEAQWVDMRERITAEMSAEGPDVETKGALGKMVPLVDVSSSMRGTPMEVAVALGILISEVAHPAVRDRFITFESEPRWHQLQNEWSLHDKVRNTMEAPWGGSTNFSKAMGLLLQACVQAQVPPEEVAELSLVVLSDMQFDQAEAGRNPWKTQYEELVDDFAAAGRKTKWGVEYPVPRIVFWNLRGDTTDYPVQSDTTGVDMLSGFSPSLLKLLMEGRLDEAMESSALVGEDTEERGRKAKADPMATVRKVLDDARYHPVRKVCGRVGEGAMAGYVAPTCRTLEVPQEDGVDV